MHQSNTTIQNAILAWHFMPAFLFFSLLFIQPAYGAITELAPLNFGTIAIKNNDANYTLRVRYTGQIINDPEIIIITSGTPAEYFLNAFPANTLLSITVSAPSSSTTSPNSPVPSNQQFTISNFDYLPSINTDANGELTFYIGATITTSASGTYDDTIYITTMSIDISY